MTATLGLLLARVAQEHPDRPALIADRTWTFAELAATASRVAARLAQVGIAPGDRVAVQLDGGAPAALLLAGLAWSGACLVPVDKRTPVARREALLADCTPAAIVTGDATAGPAAVRALALGDLLAAGSDAAEHRPCADPEAEAYVIYTSGSTGVPKGVVVRQAAIAAHADAAAQSFGLGADDRVLQFASLAFDVAQEELWATWAAGAALVAKQVDVPEPTQFGELVARRGVTVLQLPTAYWRTVTAELARVTDAPELARVRSVIVGGEAATRADLDQHDRSPLAHAAVINAYGPTECVITATAWRRPASAAPPADATALPIGAPLPGREVVVVRPDGNTATPGDTGELYLSGLLADGYLGAPELTAQRFADRADATGVMRRHYRTGDVVRVLTDGALEFVRRADEQVKLRGYRIELTEIDAVMRASGLVTDAACAVLARADAEPRLVATLVGDDGCAARMAQHLAATLPAYSVPTAFVRVRRVPLTPAGKIDRAAVADTARAESAPAASPAAAPAPDPVRTALAQLWCEVLGVDAVDDSSDFLAAGGDSLLAVRLAARARGRGLTLAPAAVLRNATFGRIADAVGAPSVPAPGRGPDAPHPSLALLPAQYRWLLDGPLPDLHHFALTALFRIGRDVPDAAVRDATAALLDQHEALRSAFDLAAPAVRAVARDLHEVVVTIDRRGAAHVAAAVRDVAEREQRSLDPASGRVFRVARIATDDGDRLLLVVHHLVLDGWSMVLLTDEFDTALSRALAGRRPLLDPPTASVAQLRSALEDYLASDLARTDARAWLGTDRTRVRRLPQPRSGPGLLGTIRTSRTTLDAVATDLVLHRVPAGIGRPADLLRAALMVAVAEDSDVGPVALDVYDTTRAAPVGDLDLTRTIGYLQASVPVLGEVLGSGAKAVLDLLGRAPLPVRPWSFDALRFLSPVPAEREALRDLPRPTLRLNYRSQLDRLERRRPDSVLQEADEDTGAHRSPAQQERYQLMFEGDVVDGRLVIGTKYSTDYFDPVQVDELTARAAELFRTAAEEVAR